MPAQRPIRFAQQEQVLAGGSTFGLQPQALSDRIIVFPDCCECTGQLAPRDWNGRILREHGSQLWRWLADGAHFYVCGDAGRMAKDVDLALRDVAAAHGGRDADRTAAYVKQLAVDGRYVRDVY